MGRIWSQSLFRWPEFDLSLHLPIFRWPEFDISLDIPNFRWPDLDFSQITSRWVPQSFRWPDLDFSIVDSVVWTVVTVFESVALASMLCFFFIFCEFFWLVSVFGERWNEVDAKRKLAAKDLGLRWQKASGLIEEDERLKLEGVQELKGMEDER